MQWTLEFTRRFRKAYKRLDKMYQERVNEAIKQLARSNIPEALGIKKEGSFAFSICIRARFRM
ncbi:MAG: hypothetical protein B9J98_01150 [Candidatus Terraquivivens tikiterensis]|uniref:Uncharacterized protein n=1 Tax=Candidatus Terraquivivens tikiterensis TaxID=1980982 RepID=A0A2R7Y9Z2_9ARCH|nr:MAG: hypothetical protein B9J98_01150 [Candidatus Terraquivivens tikiterensis]